MFRFPLFYFPFLFYSPCLGILLDSVPVRYYGEILLSEQALVSYRAKSTIDVKDTVVGIFV